MTSIFGRMATYSGQKINWDDAIASTTALVPVAYDWDAPQLGEDNLVRAGYQQRMRYRVRTAINTWDLQRLYPDSDSTIEAEEYKFGYAEDQDFSSDISNDDKEKIIRKYIANSRLFQHHK